MNEATFVKGFHNEDEIKKMKYKPLGKTGMRLSQMSLGGAPLGGLYETLNEAEGINIVKHAIMNGINYIDTAPYYGQGKSEALLGKALKDIPRSSYYIATKVGRYDNKVVDKMFDFSADRVLRGFEDSLKLLGLEYVDIIQVHDVEFAPSIDIIVNETLPAVQTIVKEGKARFIGITGYPLSPLKEIIQRSTVKIDTVLSYSRNTLFDDELSKYIPYFQEKDLGIIDAAIISMGMLSITGPPLTHAASPELKKRARTAALFCQDNGSDISHLALQQILDQPGISTSIVGIGSMEVLQKNLSTLTSAQTEKEKELIQQVKEKFFSGSFARNWENIELERYWKMKKETESNQ